MVQNMNLHEDAFNSVLEQFKDGGSATIGTKSLQGFHLGDTLRIFEIKNDYDITNPNHRAAVADGKMQNYTGRDVRCMVKACYIADDKKSYGVVLKEEE